MSHDFVRGQSVAEACFSHWGYLFAALQEKHKRQDVEIVADVGPTINQHWANVSRLLGSSCSLGALSAALQEKTQATGCANHACRHAATADI